MEDTIIYADVAILMIGRKLERLKKLKITLDKRTNVLYNNFPNIFWNYQKNLISVSIHIRGLLLVNAMVS